MKKIHRKVVDVGKGGGNGQARISRFSLLLGGQAILRVRLYRNLGLKRKPGFWHSGPMKKPLFLLALCAVFAGCHHYKTEIKGVSDARLHAIANSMKFKRPGGKGWIMDEAKLSIPLSQINVEQCPDAFRLAWQSYIHAWQNRVADVQQVQRRNGLVFITAAATGQWYTLGKLEGVSTRDTTYGP